MTVEEIGRRRIRNIRELGFDNLPAKTKEPQPETPTIPQGRDLFQTPRYAVDLLVDYLPKNINYVWEPASGEGRIVRVLESRGLKVWGTDIRYQEGIVDEYYNFLLGNEENILPWAVYPPLDAGTLAIVTNPPFSLKARFYYKCLELGVPFALLIPADYSGWLIRACAEEGAEKIIPTRRIDYITPNTLLRVNMGEGTSYSSIDDIPQHLLHKYSSSDFHSMWLTWGFNLGKTETFVELSLKEKKGNI